MHALIFGVCVSILSQVDQDNRQSNPTSVNVLPPGTHLGAVPYGENSLQLFETTRNKVQNIYKRFAYEPAFAPELNSKKEILARGPIAIKRTEADHSTTTLWQISFVLRFSTPELNKLALYEARAHLEGDKDSISPQNIRVWPIKWIQVSLPTEVKSLFPSMRIPRSNFNLNTAKSVEIKVWFDDKATADEAVSRIDEIELDLKYAQDGARTEADNIAITTRSIKASGIYNELKDLGTDIVHVRRADLKEIQERIRISTTGGRELESPDKFDQKLFADLKQHWELQFKTFDVKQFDEQMINHTWKLKDLDPHSLTKFFNKNFSVDHDIVHVKNEADVDTSGNFSLVGIFGAGGSMKSSYKKDEFKDFFRQRDITVEYEGTFVIPKAITLYSFNVGKLDAEFNDQWQDMYVSPPTSITHLDVIRLGAWKENVVATYTELASLETVLAAEAAKVAATEDFTASEETKRLVNGFTMSHYNTKAWELRRDGDVKFTVAKHRFDSAEKSLKIRRFEEAKEGFDISSNEFKAAKLAYEGVGEHPKRDGRIYKFEYRYTIGKEDKESNTGMLVRYPGGDIHIDMGSHKPGGYKSPWMSADGLNIPIQKSVSIEVGIKDGKNDQNCDVDGQFDLKLFFIDDENRRWDGSYSVPMTFYSTAGQGHGTSKTKSAVTVDRYQFPD